MNRGVYLLQGTRIYIGSTNDLERRLQEHASGKTYTTKRIGERKLAKRIPCSSEQEARALEKRLKKAGHYDRLINHHHSGL